jgi:hypothetical protein
MGHAAKLLDTVSNDTYAENHPIRFKYDMK